MSILPFSGPVNFLGATSRFPGHLGRSLAMLLAIQAVCAAGLTIQKIEPTPLFPIPPQGEPLRQRARLCLDNPGPALTAQAWITVGNSPAYREDLGRISAGRSTNLIHITDLAAPASLLVEIRGMDQPEILARREMEWQPQKKWKIHCISYSHHDLGFGNYPHRLRTEIRHANIERPLKYCAETDGWDEDSKFRFVIETSEPITSFLGSHSAAEAADLARRIQEGRIQVGGVLATVNTEQLGHELMARLFYLSGRHTPDLLGVPSGRTALIDDVIGLAWPLATALKEAGLPYFFHGYNGCGHCLKPAENEPVFYWRGPDGDDRAKVLVRSVAYGGYAGDSLGDASPAGIEKSIATLGANWPYDTLLLQEGTDFQLVTRDSADKIRNWNRQFAHPHLVCATLDLFFDAIAAQADPRQIKTFAKDGNNQWADQDATDAWLLGHARRAGEAIPAAEKWSTIASALAGGSYPWTDLYQAYHRLLLYHEHTDAIDYISPNRERMRQYETELVENREMVLEAEEFCEGAQKDALAKVESLVPTQSERSLLVFNSLPHIRTDVVRFTPESPAGDFRIVDDSDGREAAYQLLPDGQCIFLAREVPATGYKVYSLLPGGTPAKPVAAPAGNRLENHFYRLAFHPQTGALTSLQDRELGVELVDQAAPHHLNEYLYERFEQTAGGLAPVWHRVESAQISVSTGPVATLLTVKAAPAGVENLQQTILLYHDLKRIDFGLDIVKSPSGRKSRQKNTDLLHKESVYVAMPFAVPDFRFKHELPGGVVEPIRDQFEGSCTAYYAVRHFSDVSNERFGITVSPVENSLVEYGYPRSCPIIGGREHEFERDLRYPAHSRLYLYLADNMFDVNVRWDQPGPMRFTWSLRSHAGDWRRGAADTFGWEVHNPLQAQLAHGRKAGLLPPSFGFLGIDTPNVACTTIKPAEANGAGYILRFHETRGLPTTATVKLGFVGQIAAAAETDLVENDKPQTLPIEKGGALRIALPAMGWKTIRVTCPPVAGAAAVRGLSATGISDMQVKLAWQAQPGANYYHVYRGATPDFKPSLLGLVARPSTAGHVDQPQLHLGGWINNRLSPATAYYYRVAAVYPGNQEGPASEAVAATTAGAEGKNLVPLKVEGLRAIPVSPIAPLNFVNLLFRTSCECDVRSYEIHRSTNSGFDPAATAMIGVVEASSPIKGSTEYGHVPIDYHAGDYDHLMFEDTNALPHTTYYYRVRAVDGIGQKGPFSNPASARTGAPAPPPIKAAASSVYAPQYGPEGAVDGSLDPLTAWVSKPYGRGTPEAPSAAWLEVELPRPLWLRGVVIAGDERAVIPLQKGWRIELRENGAWVTAAAISNAHQKTIRSLWESPRQTSAIRVYVPAADLPKSQLADIPDGVVRIAELLLVLPDGREAAIPDLP